MVKSPVVKYDSPVSKSVSSLSPNHKKRSMLLKLNPMNVCEVTPAKHYKDFGQLRKTSLSSRLGSEDFSKSAGRKRNMEDPKLKDADDLMEFIELEDY